MSKCCQQFTTLVKFFSKILVLSSCLFSFHPHVFSYFLRLHFHARPDWTEIKLYEYLKDFKEKLEFFTECWQPAARDPGETPGSGARLVACEPRRPSLGIRRRTRLLRQKERITIEDKLTLRVFGTNVPGKQGHNRLSF